MADPGDETDFQNELRAKHEAYFAIADELISLAKQVAEDRPLVLQSAFDGLATFFFVKSYKTFSAIVVLASKGFGEDAAVLSRGLVENATNLVYIARDPEARTDLYLEYEYVARNRHVKMLESAGAFDLLGMRPQLAASREELRRLYESVKHKYPNENLWSGRTMRVMADEVGLASHYRYAYKFFSDLAHGGPSTINQFVQPGEQAGMVGVMFGPDDSFIVESLMWSCDLFWRVLDQNNDLFALGLEVPLTELRNRMHAVFGGPVESGLGSGSTNP